MTPLKQLIVMLDKGERPAFDWMVEHAGDGTFLHVWNSSEDPSELLFFYGFTDERVNLARAVVACVRRVGVPRSVDRMHERAVDALERWTRHPNQKFPEEERMNAFLVRVVTGSDGGDRGLAASQAVDDAIEFSVPRDLPLWKAHEAFVTARQELAGVVRKMLKCPTIEDVYRA